MNITLRWLASEPACSLYTIAALLAGRALNDAALQAALARPAADFAEFLATHHIPPARLFQHLVPLSAGIGNPFQLAETTLNKVVGRNRSQAVVEQLARDIAELE